MMKKVFAFAATTVLCLMFCGMPVFAEEEAPMDTEEGRIIVTVDNDATALEEGTKDTAPKNDAKPEEEWPTSFSDVGESDWFYDSVKFVAEKHIFAGTGEGKFSPNASLTRAMLVTIVYRYVGSPEVQGAVNFSDIDTNEYYYKALIWGVQNNIINGYPDGKFLPNTAISRQDVAVILCRVAKYKGIAVDGWLDLYDFSDGDNTMDYAKFAMRWAYSHGILTGKGGGIIAPLSNATRAECAKLIRYFDGADLAYYPTAVPSLFNGDHAVTYSAMCEYLDTMTKVYPNLIRVSNIGATEEGREMKQVAIGTGSRYIYMQGNLHAREYLALNYLLEILDSYSYAYATNAAFDGYNVRSLLSTFTIIMVPCANPDGQNIAINGYSAAANPSAVAAMYNPTGKYTQWKANAQGVDLNRNFPQKWTQGSTKRPAYMEYAGPSAGSAKEVQNIVRVFSSYNFETALDCHTAGNLLYYSDNDCSAAYANRAGALANRMAAVSGYRPATSTNGGGCSNYVRHTLGVPGITVELYPYVIYPLDTRLFSSMVWSRAKDFPLVTMDFLLNG